MSLVLWVSRTALRAEAGLSEHDATWFAVHTKPWKEGLVARLLHHQGYETLYLHHATTVKHARRTRMVLRALFPRYVFAASSPAGVYDIRTAQCGRPQSHDSRAFAPHHDEPGYHMWCRTGRAGQKRPASNNINRLAAEPLSIKSHIGVTT